MNLLEGNDQVTIDENKDYFQELVGEGKKFKDEKDLAKGKFLSDIYIKDLEKGRDELRADYLKLREENMARAKLEELVDRLSKQSQPSDETLNANGGQEQPKFDLKEVESLISNKLSEMEALKRQQENLVTVQNKLQEHFGANYRTLVKQEIADLGMSDEDFNAMASKNPKALFRTLGLDRPTQESFQAPLRNERQSDSFAPSSPVRTWTWYEDLRRKDPKRYWEPKTQVQMHKDHATLGKKFEDGNWATY